MKILVACPPNTVTGGVELLHQLCHELNGYGWIDAKIWYINEDLQEPPQPSAYDEYNNDFVITTEPEKGSTLIFPEVYAALVNHPNFAGFRKVIYWESVDNYLSNTPSEQALRFPYGILHLAQSHYAMDFLREFVKAEEKDIIFVTDFLNESYLKAEPKAERKRQIAFNPAKGLEFTQMLMAAMPEERFVPIKDMTKEQVRDLLCESSVYIDFGNHPGKDRIPREACICGCVVITSTNGSARFHEDVPIDERYKINVNAADAVENCKRIVKDALDNYDFHNAYFEPYREQIRGEREMFERQVEMLATRLKTPKFSIIIPAHNAEEHGLKAFHSIKSQRFTDYECIVVCDACEDMTAEVAMAFGFHAVRTNFGNDGLARSMGLDLARGEWVLFMDDDDWWLHDFVLEQLAEKLEQVDCDALLFSFIWQHVGYAKPLGNRGFPWPAVWNKCWRRDFIGKTRFPNVYSVSDSFFHREMMLKEPRMAVWDMPLYYYNYLRPGSISELARKGENNGNQRG